MIESNKELLELAALAYGIDVEFCHPCSTHTDEYVCAKKDDYGPNRKWNPIDDNNVAFLLAVKLEMEVNLNSGKVKVCDRTQPKPKYLVVPIEVTDDAASATRRAIVKAAAEIGRSIK